MPPHDASLAAHRAAELLIPCERVISPHCRTVRAPLAERPERRLINGVAGSKRSNLPDDLRGLARGVVALEDLSTRYRSNPLNAACVRRTDADRFSFITAKHWSAAPSCPTVVRRAGC